MYKINSGFRWTLTAKAESEIVTLVLLPETLDADHQQLEQQRQANIAMLNNCCEINSNYNFIKTSSDQYLEYLLSNLLKYGVLIASAVIVLGGILYLISHGAEPAQYHFFQGSPSDLRSPLSIINAVLSGSSQGIIQCGLLILVAIPILRVIISFLIFLVQREFIYVIITSLVLASLTYSLIGAHY
ncbi:DUF1634 domain-containing protein [Sphaerospermopsis aphanizomenoides BCCUSP55]|uniref:DUF1634 domain-containing protein n=1 Tax=Sphaerospermopsis aphanizomenoides TaxID=459663 RepID=UPI001907BA45|nr:DUF1634 domain-containing protein [Sphaerospermopsis aphanizomenoides]MBK1987796.1 DUF1634 domain-containing protein [Sphaerospermopsis aphanizomenoides BCCUSP55]